MIEIYLFVNPVGTECYQVEKTILDLVEKETPKKIQFRFIPFVSMQVVDAVIQKYQLPKKDLALRNHLFETMFQAALDYKAVQLQGKKKGRQFLLRLQEACGFQKKPYTTELIESLVEGVDGDLAEFRLDRASNFVKEAFFTDQQIARDMSIEENPSCVVYNYSCERDFGVLIEGKICQELSTLTALCKTTPEWTETPTDFLEEHTPKEKSGTHLHLLS